jgi:hypothetical protein
MRYEIINLDLNHPSFNWANGTYIVVNENYEDTALEICKFENGKPEMDYTGKNFSCSVTGKNNPGVKRTGKFYIDNRFRKEKLERILQ